MKPEGLSIGASFVFILSDFCFRLYDGNQSRCDSFVEEKFRQPEVKGIKTHMTEKLCFVTLSDKYFFGVPDEVQTSYAPSVCFQGTDGIDSAGSPFDKECPG